MAKDKRPWRKFVKKLRRARIRQNKADAEKKDVRSIVSSPETESLELEQQTPFNLDESTWNEREQQSQRKFLAARLMNEKMEKAKAAEKEQERMLRELENLQRVEVEQANELKQKVAQQIAKQVADLAKFLDEFLKGFLTMFLIDVPFYVDCRMKTPNCCWLFLLETDTPPVAYLMSTGNSSNEDMQPCLYFSRTGACRFYDRCRDPHPSPVLSCTILIPNFFHHSSLSLESGEEGTAVSLAFENSDIFREYLEFEDDVLMEFRKHGNVIQFKVCRNFEPHLHGNVYIQYENIREAVTAYQVFNGRYYNGIQITLHFVKLVSWRNAICGAFNRGICVKGKSCNYLHVFRNATSQFKAADNDWQPPTLPHQLESRNFIIKRSNVSTSSSPLEFSKPSKLRVESSVGAQSQWNRKVDNLCRPSRSPKLERRTRESSKFKSRHDMSPRKKRKHKKRKDKYDRHTSRKHKSKKKKHRKKTDT